MDSCIGLDYIVENPEYVKKLASAIDTSNVTVKKQAFELLSALCVYSAEGQSRALDALEKYKELKGERYRLHVIVKELAAATAKDYQKALVAFINCLIISTQQLSERIRIRNEFIGLKLLPVLNDIRRQGVASPELVVQLDVFDEQREADEAQVLQGPNGVDLSSHLDIFYAILRQVADTPQEIPFLSILQHLLRIDPKDAVSDIVWDTAETLVHRATLLENRQDASRLLRSPSIQGKLNCHCTCHGYRGGGGDSRKPSLISSAASPPPPPPPPPLPNIGPPPPPPPPPGILAPGPPTASPRLGPLGPPSTNGGLGGPPQPPPLLESRESPLVANDSCDSTNTQLLPQQAIPTPKAKMKTINWNKIPNHKVVGKHNIWSLVARSHQNAPMPELDWAEMEGLFCQQAPAAMSLPPLTASPRLGRDSHEVERKRKESSEIALLDGKRSLNVNIFLKQFRTSNGDIIQLIKEGGHDDIGAEKLRGLLKLLPEIDELEMLKAFNGDTSKLGNAEKFLLQLIQVSNYKLRIESMLLKEEFSANMGYLEPSINAMIVAGEELMTNKRLQEVLYMVVVAGNFLNFGGYAGNAAGVKLSSLQKLTDIRANKPGMNLIHYVALQAEKTKKELLSFPGELSALEEATKTTTEQLQNEIVVLDVRIKKIRKQIELPSTENDIKDQMVEFLAMAEQELRALQKDLGELESVRKALAEFFCEDQATFKLEECFKILHSFCTKFRQAVQENERRKIQEEQTYLRRKLREDQAAKKRQLSTAGSDVEGLMEVTRTSSERDAKLQRVHSGPWDEETSSPGVSRRRIGSFSSPPDEVLPQDTYSPDITPTGSLRRRRSRVPSEDDDSNLMDFLRASGHDVGQRKSWGSLDRSWARRARGSGGGRKRPDLLSADFSVGRERPTSPSPLAEDKTILHPSEPEEKPKAWKQKIEAWLKENEKEDSDHGKSEDMKRRTRRLQNVNRKSLEADSESDSRGGNLVTLPEEHTGARHPNPVEYKRVYSDWKPAIEKTDVVGAMEAIEGAQNDGNVKDKSIWRKSNLNLPEYDNVEEDSRRLRRLRSRSSIEQITPPSPLRSIQEEDKRKNLISALSQEPAEDKLTLYLRRPSGEESPLVRGGSLRNPSRRSDSGILPPSMPKRIQRQDEVISDKIEIDSDNIETPPVTRRKFTKLRDLSLGSEPHRSAESKYFVELHRGSSPSHSDKESERSSLLRNSQRLREIATRGDQDEVLGDGQFDRFSSARRTRRYKKSHEAETGDEKEPSPTRMVTSDIVKETIPTLHANSEPVESVDEKEARLKAWQDRLKYHGTPINEEGARVAQVAITDINKVGAELKTIGNDVNSPVQKSSTLPRLVSPASRRDKIPKKDDCVRRDRARGIGERNQAIDTSKAKRTQLPTSVSQKISTPLKIRDSEMNDEGFEESQSMGSETPSQGTLSGNYDTIDSSVGPEANRFVKLDRADSSGSGDTNTSSSTNAPPKKVVRGESLDKSSRLTGASFSPLNRSTSVRLPKTLENKLLAPLKRSSSLKKSDSQSSMASNKTINNGNLKRNGVERSNSKGSLRSSRSSLNSATSVNTVKNVPKSITSPSSFTKITAGYTSAIKTLTSDLEKIPSKSNPSRDAALRRAVAIEQKRPFSLVQTKISEKSKTVPASRSSSSGSSIGPSARRPRLSPHLSTSFKENIGRVRSPASLPLSGDVKLLPESKQKSSRPKENSSNTVHPKVGLSFMRPTASSTAKDLEIPSNKLRTVPKKFLK